MKTTVAVVNTDSFSEAISRFESFDFLNSPDRKVVIKVGIYNTKTGICTTVKTLESIIKSFDRANEILVAESDSGAGPGLERLEIWKECYNDRVIPFNLSSDTETREVNITGEDVPFSHVLLEPNTFVSTHVARRYEEAGLEDLMNLGFIIKNLLGLILDTKKHRFHEQLSAALVDMYEVIGGIDLAVIDGTNVYLGLKEKRITVSPRVLIVGTDAFAVEAVGMHMVGFDPLENPVLQEARDRGLGEINIDRIKINGDIETPRQIVLDAFSGLR
ncbi:MAG: DUF362 domain-containing protein [Candidatus Thorarchaeota archaeon]|jgi:uncharacterized protein (DUF362 family)